MNDLINRQDAIDEVNKQGLNAFEKLLVETILMRLPSAQKTGHWIPLIKDEPLDPRVKCSECGNAEILHCGNYCPNCGAKMEV